MLTIFYFKIFALAYLLKKIKMLVICYMSCMNLSKHYIAKESLINSIISQDAFLNSFYLKLFVFKPNWNYEVFLINLKNTFCITTNDDLINDI
ncbi:hypothetical protein NUSPORA_02180 [Nucleospora cyclopteri]